MRAHLNFKQLVDGIDPVIRPDSEYPDYVLHLTDPVRTMSILYIDHRET